MTIVGQDDHPEILGVCGPGVSTPDGVANAPLTRIKTGGFTSPRATLDAQFLLCEPMT